MESSKLNVKEFMGGGFETIRITDGWKEKGRGLCSLDGRSKTITINCHVGVWFSMSKTSSMEDYMCVSFSWLEASNLLYFQRLQTRNINFRVELLFLMVSKSSNKGRVNKLVCNQLYGIWKVP